MNKMIISNEPSIVSLSDEQFSEELDLSLVKIPSSSPREILHQEFSVSYIKINYSRPSIGSSKRKIFGDGQWSDGLT
jgi:hypothetical protein